MTTAAKIAAIGESLTEINAKLELLRSELGVTPMYRRLSFDYLDKQDVKQKLLAKRERLLEEARTGA